MKKITLFLFVALTFAGVMNAQLLSEDFSGNFPPSGWTIDSHATNWDKKNSNNAGGTAPEARFAWTPQFNGDSRLISPAIDLTGVNTVTLKFKHSINHYGGPYTVGVATRTGTSGTWNTVWSMAGADITEEKVINISNSDTGQNDFQFCFFFSGNSYNINYWYIDDVEISATPNLDLEVNELQIPDYAGVGQALPIAVKLYNLGQNDITTFDIAYTVDGANNVSETVNATIHPTESYTHVFSTNWTPVTGTHQIEVTISNVNGGTDDETGNDVLSKNVIVASQVVSNFPLFEEFTSSTCSPCASFNSSVLNPFTNNHQTDIALVKYQMNWPGSGDPYYTAEGGVRRAYYGVSGVPNLFVGGTKYSTTSSGVNSAYNNETSRDSYMDMTAQFSLQGSTIDVSVTITPYVTGNFTAQIVVVEKETTGNTGSNGETSFKHVMMKMLPDANGTSVSLTDGTPVTLNYSYDMSSTNVEELSDLAVVAFVQDDGNKKVMQSVYAPTETNSVDEFIFKNVKLYPNPFHDKIFLETQDEINYSVMDLSGRTIVNEKNVANNEFIDLSNFPNGIYLLKLSDNQHTELRKIIKK